MNTPILLINEHCGTGENPLWDAERNCVFWTDIPNGKIFRLDVENGTHETIYRGPQVGGFTLQANGDLLLFRVDDVALLAADGRVRTVVHFTDEGMSRFNDVIADPEGRVFAGTIGKTKESGGLYRLDRDGAIAKLFSGTGCANGMGFSPDLRTFYWTCSTRRRIYQYAYDRTAGELSDERLFYQANEGEGTPDGLCVDNTGHVWSARWDGHAIFRHNARGKVIEKLMFPVAKVSSACFGGRELDTLYVTTAGGKPGATTLDGALFKLRVAVIGLPEHRSQIAI